MARSALTTRLPQTNSLQVGEAHDFSGGLNTFDTLDGLTSRYLVEARNVYPDTNGKLRIRYGMSPFADVAVVIDYIVNMVYFNGRIVLVGGNGVIVSIDASSTMRVHWSTVIAATKLNSPTGWSTGFSMATFTHFAGNLIICNGVDKPLVMSPVFNVEYLADLGTGSNLNVPRARFCATHNDFLVLASTADAPSTLFIASRGTIGTFLNDPGVDNNAVNFTLDKFVSTGNPSITGITTFRDRLIVTFEEVILAARLGDFDNANAHVPAVTDVIAGHGCISYRCLVPLGDDVFFFDHTGMISLRRSLLNATLSPVRESTLIASDIQEALALFSPAEMAEHVFAVHDRIGQAVLLFIPKSKPVTHTTDNHVFVYCFDRTQKFRAWTYFDQLPYRTAVCTVEGRVFFGSKRDIDFYHNHTAPIYTNILDRSHQLWDDGMLWDDGTGWNEATIWTAQPISFTIAFPWTTMREPGKLKYSKYAQVVAEGGGEFTLAMHIDNLDAPALSMTMQQTVAPAEPPMPLRPANNAQLYAWPQKFEKMRLRITGTTSQKFIFSGLRIMYQVGSIRR